MDLLQGDQIGLFGNIEPVATAGERVKHDYYPTPEAITRELIKRVDLQSAVLEPCCGQGAISEALKKYAQRVTIVFESDIASIDRLAQCVKHPERVNRDATTQAFWNYWDQYGMPISWVVTNPPFSCAAEILAHAWEYAEEGCAFLLRLSFLEPTGNRAEMLKSMSDHLRYVIPVSPRPKFRRDTTGSDSVTCAWFVWDKRWSWQREIGADSPFQFVSGWR